MKKIGVLSNLYQLFVFFTLSLCPLCASSSTICIDPISNFLQNKVIDIPDSSVLVSGDNYLLITKAQCRNIGLQSMPSKYIPITLFSLGINDMSITCTGHYSYTFLKGGMKAVISKLSASMEMKINKTQEFPTSILVNDCQVPKVTIDITFTGGIGKNILNLLTAALEGFIEDEIKKLLCVEVVSLLQVNMTRVFNNTINPALKTIIHSPPDIVPDIYSNTQSISPSSAFFSTLISSSPSVLSSSPLLSSTYLDWGVVATVVNRTLTCFAHNHPEIAKHLHRPLLNQLMDYITHGTGTVIIPLAPLSPVSSPLSSSLMSSEADQSSIKSSATTLSAGSSPKQQQQNDLQQPQQDSYSSVLFPPLPSLPPFSHPTIDSHNNNFTYLLPNNATLTLHSLSVSGLDTFTELLLFKPKPTSSSAAEATSSSDTDAYTDNTSTVSILEMKQLTVLVNVTYQSPSISTEPSAERSCYQEQLQMKLQLSNIQWEMSTVVAVNKKTIYSLVINQLFQSGCLLSAFDYVNISSLILRTTLENIELVQLSGDAVTLEKDGVFLLNQMSRLLSTGFKELVSEVLQGVVQGTLRPLMNKALTKTIDQAKRDKPCIKDSNNNNNLYNKNDEDVLPFITNLVAAIITPPSHSYKNMDMINSNNYADNNDDDDDDGEYIAWSHSKLIRLVNMIINRPVNIEVINSIIHCATVTYNAVVSTTSNIGTTVKATQSNSVNSDSYFDLISGSESNSNGFTGSSNNSDKDDSAADTLIADTSTGGSAVVYNTDELVIALHGLNTFRYLSILNPYPDVAVSSLKTAQHFHSSSHNTNVQPSTSTADIQLSSSEIQSKTALTELSSSIATQHTKSRLLSLTPVPLPPIAHPYNIMNHIGLGSCTNTQCTPFSIEININLTAIDNSMDNDDNDDDKMSSNNNNNAAAVFTMLVNLLTAIPIQQQQPCTKYSNSPLHQTLTAIATDADTSTKTSKSTTTVTTAVAAALTSIIPMPFDLSDIIKTGYVTILLQFQNIFLYLDLLVQIKKNILNKKTLEQLTSDGVCTLLSKLSTLSITQLNLLASSVTVMINDDTENIVDITPYSTAAFQTLSTADTISGVNKRILKQIQSTNATCNAKNNNHTFHNTTTDSSTNNNNNDHSSGSSKTNNNDNTNISNTETSSFGMNWQWQIPLLISLGMLSTIFVFSIISRYTLVWKPERDAAEVRRKIIEKEERQRSNNKRRSVRTSTDIATKMNENGVGIDLDVKRSSSYYIRTAMNSNNSNAGGRDNNNNKLLKCYVDDEDISVMVDIDTPAAYSLLQPLTYSSSSSFQSAKDYNNSNTNSCWYSIFCSSCYYCLNFITCQLLTTCEQLNWSESIIGHSAISIYLRIFIFVMLALNYYLFVQSNMTSAAVAVMMEAVVGMHSYTYEVFEMGLMKTVHDMWAAETYWLAGLIAFFSGGWSYVKLTFMLFSFILPPDCLSVTRRQSILRVMDCLGKWSLIDNFVMFLFSSAFYFEIALGMEVGVFLTVQSRWGYYSFILAVLISLVLGHIILACHRYIINQELNMDLAHLHRETQQQESVQNSNNSNCSYSNEYLPPSSSSLKNTSTGATSCDNDGHIYTTTNQMKPTTASSSPHTIINLKTEVESMVSHMFLISTRLYPNASTTVVVDVPQYIRDTTTENIVSADDGVDDDDSYDRMIEDDENFNGKADVDYNHDMKRTTPHSTPTKRYSKRNTTTTTSHRLKTIIVQKARVPLKITSFGKCIIVLFFTFTSFCILCGTFLNTFTFIFQGLIGVLLQKKSTVNYGFVTLGLAFPASTGQPQLVANIGLQICYFLFGLIMPLLTLTTSYCVWFIPLTLSWQKFMLVIVEIFNAWSALDVFAVALIAGVLQLPLFSAFIVGSSCNDINLLLRKYLDKILHLHGDDICFEVVGIIQNNSWYLFTGAVLLLLIMIPSLILFQQCIEERQVKFIHDERMKQKQQLHYNQQQELTSNTSNAAIVTNDGTLRPHHHPNHRYFSPLESVFYTESTNNNNGSANNANYNYNYNNVHHQQQPSQQQDNLSNNPFESSPSASPLWKCDEEYTYHILSSTTDHQHIATALAPRAYLATDPLFPSIAPAVKTTQILTHSQSSLTIGQKCQQFLLFTLLFCRIIYVVPTDTNSSYNNNNNNNNNSNNNSSLKGDKGMNENNFHN